MSRPMSELAAFALAAIFASMCNMANVQYGQCAIWPICSGPICSGPICLCAAGALHRLPSASSAENRRVTGGCCGEYHFVFNQRAGATDLRISFFFTTNFIFLRREPSAVTCKGSVYCCDATLQHTAKRAIALRPHMYPCHDHTLGPKADRPAVVKVKTKQCHEI